MSVVCVCPRHKRVVSPHVCDDHTVCWIDPLLKNIFANSVLQAPSFSNALCAVHNCRNIVRMNACMHACFPVSVPRCYKIQTFCSPPACTPHSSAIHVHASCSIISSNDMIINCFQCFFFRLVWSHSPFVTMIRTGCHSFLFTVSFSLCAINDRTTTLAMERHRIDLKTKAAIEERVCPTQTKKLGSGLLWYNLRANQTSKVWGLRGLQSEDRYTHKSEGSAYPEPIFFIVSLAEASELQRHGGLQKWRCGKLLHIFFCLQS